MAFPWVGAGLEAGLWRHFWQEGSGGLIWCDISRFDRHKMLKSRFLALSKAGSRWYIPPATQGHLPGVSLLRKPPDGIGALARWPMTFRHSVFRQGAQWFIAGWSSPVARQAHNLKVTGSNPVPATKQASDLKRFFESRLRGGSLFLGRVATGSPPGARNRKY